MALLRARGGISNGQLFVSSRCNSSPRTRRYFLSQGNGPSRGRLFSAHAEVFPDTGRFTSAVDALLRARGGISNPARM